MEINSDSESDKEPLIKHQETNDVRSQNKSPSENLDDLFHELGGMSRF